MYVYTYLYTCIHLHMRRHIHTYIHTDSSDLPFIRKALFKHVNSNLGDKSREHTLKVLFDALQRNDASPCGAKTASALRSAKTASASREAN